MTKIKWFSAWLLALTLSLPSVARAQPSLSAFADAQVALAFQLYRQGDFSGAHRLLDQFIDQRLTVPEWKNAPVDDSWIEAIKAFAECCFQLEDYQRAITIYDNLERLGASDAQTASNRGMCYQELDQWLPAIDNFRLAHLRQPNELLHRLVLAKALVTAPHASLRDSRKAASLLTGLQQPLPSTAPILEIQAAIAAEEGDSDRAVKLQSQAILLERDERTKAFATSVRDLYQGQTRFPFIEEGRESMPELERVQAISAGTVIGRVRGRAFYKLDGGAGCALRVIENQHAGLVLNDRGDFLISSTSLAISYTAEPTWGSVDGAEWIEGPFIEVYETTPSPQGVVSLGRAQVKGMDEATGLALIRLSDYPSSEARRKLVPLRLKPTYGPGSDDQVINDALTVRLNVWSPLQPENHFEVLTEDKAFGEIRFSPLLEKAEVHFYQSLTTLNRWNAPSSRRVDNWCQLEAPELTIGAPVINAAGECIAIVDERRGEDGLFKAGIPADVIARVAARLLSFGEVE